MVLVHQDRCRWAKTEGNLNGQLSEFEAEKRFESN